MRFALMRAALRSVSAVVLLNSLSFAANADTLTASSISSSGTKSATVTTRPFDRSNPTAATTPPASTPVNGQLGQRCDADFRCDDWALSVTVTQAYLNANPNATLKITADWQDPGKGVQSLTDFDVYLRASPTSSENLGTGGAGSGNPEVITLIPSVGTISYSVRLVPYLTNPAGVPVTLTAELDDGAAGGGGGGPANVSAGGPTFRTHDVPGSIASGASEPTMGVDLTTNRAYILLGYDAVGALFDGSGNPTWNNAQGGIAPISGDPFMASNPHPINLGTGAGQCNPQQADFPKQCVYSPRIWNIQLAVATSFMSFSDNNGGTWTQSTGPGQVHGADNQSVAAGPYPAASKPVTAVPPSSINYAVYYCSHGVVNAFCSRSDDGGMNFGPSRPIFPLEALCNNHGHVKVGIDGTVYVPMNNSCEGTEGVSVSVDAGETWHYISVPATVRGRWDSSIAAGGDGKTVYYAYGEEGTDDMMIIKGTLSKTGNVPSITWHQPAANLSAPHGLKNIVFAAVVAGDANRAAVAFHGTTTEGDSGTFSGAIQSAVWHMYVGTTYDGGANWQVRRVSEDPTQRGDICDQGTNCATTGNHRNLLDFMDAELDRQGRILVGYADGCTSATCINAAAGTVGTEFNDLGVIARQSTGLGLYAAYDDVLGGGGSNAPGAPVLSGFRDDFGAYVNWTVPSAGNSALSSYKVERSVNGGIFRQIGTVPSTLTKFTDGDALDTDMTYRYQVIAVNAAGLSGDASLAFAPALLPESLCTGLTMLTDGSGEFFAGVVPTLPVAPGAIDALSLKLSQPGATVTAGDYDIVFELKMRDLSVLPAGVTWPVNMNVDGVTIEPIAGSQTQAAGFQPHFTVQMHTNPPATPAAPAFELVRNPSSRTPYNTTLGTRLVTALTGSSYSAATGIITLKIKASQFASIAGGALVGGLKNPGTDKLINFITRISVQGATPDNMPDNLTPTGVFATGSRYICAANTPPVAALGVSAMEGGAPLTVNFNASASSDMDAASQGDTIRSYLFKFADTNGGEEYASANPVVTRNYSSTGNYAYSLRVQDSRGKLSTAVSGIIVVNEQADRSPDIFSFANMNNAPRNADVSSVEITVSGLGNAVSVPVTVANGFYIKNGGAATSAAGSVVNGDKLRLGHRSSTDFSTSVISTLTVGDKSASFTSTTADPDTVPNAFSFGTKTNVARATLITSNTITPAGYNAPAVVLAGAGTEYSIGCTAAFTSTASSIVPGQSICMRHTSAAAGATVTKTSLSIGGVTAYFTTKTAP